LLLLPVVLLLLLPSAKQHCPSIFLAFQCIGASCFLLLACLPLRAKLAAGAAALQLHRSDVARLAKSPAEKVSADSLMPGIFRRAPAKQCCQRVPVFFFAEAYQELFCLIWVQLLGQTLLLLGCLNEMNSGKSGFKEVKKPGLILAVVLTPAAQSFQHFPRTFTVCAVWRKPFTDSAGAASVQPSEGRALL